MLEEPGVVLYSPLKAGMQVGNLEVERSGEGIFPTATQRSQKPPAVRLLL
jgi:hypothetical protein